MDFNLDLNLVQSQKILLTPQLKQVLDILIMNSQELFEYVEEQLEENPVLEAGENGSFVDDEITSFLNGQEEDELFDGKKEFREADEDQDETRDIEIDKTGDKISLKEHLLLQLHTSELDEKQTMIGEYLVDNIDENGYLNVDISEIAQFYNVDAGKVNIVLTRIQSFDPPGICARDVKECLLIQLRQANKIENDTEAIIEKHLDELADGEIDKIINATGMDRERVEAIFNLIKTLEPKPGREFYLGSDVKLLIPDVIIKRINNRFEVLVNDDSIPFLNINEYYRKIMTSDVSGDVRKFISSKIECATWLIKCIELRKSTLGKIAECIILSQQDFFERGKKYLKPLSMKEMAEEANMHESVLESILNGKYLQCLWGIFEMRQFVS